MKKLFSSAFFLLCLYCPLPAQNFVPIGTTWHHTGIAFTPFWEKTTYEKDTLTSDGRSCMKLSFLRQNFGSAGPGMPYYPSGQEHSYRLFYQSGDTLYERSVSGVYSVFFVLNGSIGDSWETQPPIIESQTCTLYNRTRIIDTGTVVINGKSLRYWDLGPETGSFISMEGRLIEQFGIYVRSFYSKIHGGFGSGNCSQGIFEDMHINFSCFESDSIGFYNIPHWPYSECEFNFSLGETEAPAIRVFPNPVTDILYIDPGSGVFDIDILDMQGRVQRTLRQQTPGAGIPFGEFPSGIYMACIKRPGHPEVWQKLVKN
ncbi:MAG: T9SS type A sorting domain-containing protein [Bacteroidia bacterium]|nr:T9SS type A sorting domain-containing protein [Bacteroidia bacterium]